eukprot:4809802-Prymnesium_polylepis.1
MAGENERDPGTAAARPIYMCVSVCARSARAWFRAAHPRRPVAALAPLLQAAGIFHCVDRELTWVGRKRLGQRLPAFLAFRG